MTLKDFEKAGYADPEAVFAAVALAGGFGAVPPSHEGGLDVDGIVDAKTKTAVDKVLSTSAKKGKDTAKNNDHA